MKSKAGYRIGIDMGTTSTKAVVFDREGRVVATANEGYPLYTPTPSIAEQDPEEIFAALVRAVGLAVTQAGLQAGDVEFVSCSSAMHSVIPVDGEGKPLMRGMTWADNRSAEWARKLKDELNGLAVYRRTGTPIHPMSPITKLMWLRHDHPELFAKAAKFVSIKEYALFRLFGRYVVDYSIASATGMMNLSRLEWDEEALGLAGLTQDRLSELVPTTYVLEGMTNPEAAAQMGLSASTPFVVGASDGVLSNLGLNAIDPGVVAVTIGTSGAIRTVIDEPATDPKGRYFCYALTDKKWVIGGPVNNGGVIFRWVRDEFAASETETAKRLGISPYDVLTRIAERVRPGSDGLLFLPYLTGERAPLWNPDARGSFFGLTLHHQKEHMIRAVLEGVVYNLYTVMLAMQETTGVPKKILATGGFARSPLWRQMMADIFGQNVVVPESFESSCLGAVVLGMQAFGDADAFSRVAAMVGTTHEHIPQPAASSVYRELLPLFVRLSRKLDEEYADIAKFQQKLFNQE
ncbi:gluconokinase [Cohnella thailandensis]|uniref:Gluconokinase n=1 Tax=Cohnella thailandensis TaxID=557557 RepID=A0A841T6U3_9BACL|nr:gluconokinase [Cohnella thailandensis]MBB6636881.1 gluconokinase [Cohnella thailandensis]MBP1973239.1 gluconokinase [Cohnella thailandensis]